MFLTPNGLPFAQVTQHYAWMEPLTSEFEMAFNPRAAVRFASANVWLPLAVCAAYCVLVEVGRWVMAGRQPLKLKGVLLAWNLALSAFSFLGLLKTMPMLIHNVTQSGFESSLCAPAETAYGCGATGLWTALFIFSKIPELGDTVFLVLRKREVNFLHWYHHVSVLLYAWWSYATRSSAGLWFVTFNYMVHAVMYLYFGLTTLGFRNNAVAFVITLLQISQMVVGVMICAAVPLFVSRGSDCSMTAGAYAGGIVMYGSYFYLFLMFAIARYCSSGKESKPKQD